MEILNSSVIQFQNPHYMVRLITVEMNTTHSLLHWEEILPRINYASKLPNNLHLFREISEKYQRMEQDKNLDRFEKKAFVW